MTKKELMAFVKFKGSVSFAISNLEFLGKSDDNHDMLNIAKQLKAGLEEVNKVI